MTKLDRKTIESRSVGELAEPALYNICGISIINTRWAKTEVTIELGRLKLVGIMCADAN